MQLFRRLRWLFPSMLVVTVAQNYYDLSVLMSEGTLSLFQYEGPSIYKVLKDVLYLLLLSSILLHAERTSRLPITRSSGAFVIIVFFMVILSATDNGAFVGMIGLRWIFPFVLFLLMRDWSMSLDTVSAVPWIMRGLAGCLALQVYQLFNMPPVFGEILPGISARTPGFFVAPNSAAFFSCASASCLMVFSPLQFRLNLLAVVFALMVSALAQSGTGMVCAALLFLRVLCGHRHLLFWGLALGALALALPNLDFIAMRENYVELSGGGRLDAFWVIFRESALSVARFGLYTNAANLFSVNPEDQLAPDSLIASWVGNFGLFASLAIALVVFFIRSNMRGVSLSWAMPCLLVFGVFSMTTVVFEAFPMNLYLALGVWSARRTKTRGSLILA